MSNLSKKAQSETHWAWAMIVVTIIVAGGMMSYVTRSSSGAEVVQEYISNNFAPLFNTIISSPGVVVYRFNTSLSGYDFKVSLYKSHSEIASKIKSVSGEDSYTQPSIKLHTYPQDYELIGENTYTEPFYIIKSGKEVYLQKEDPRDIECLSYMKYKYPKQQSETSLLLLSSSQNTINKLQNIARNLGTKTTVSDLESAYSAAINDKNGIDKFDIVLIMEESSSKESILLANPLLSSKKIGCSLKEVLTHDAGDSGVENQGAESVFIEQSKLDVNADYEILSLLNLNELNEDAIIRGINGLFDTKNVDGVEA